MKLLSSLLALPRLLLQGGGSLRLQVLRGSVWVLATQSAQQLLSLGRSIILARLLSPDDFGIMSLALVAIGALTVFTEMGIASALIQRKELDTDYLHTAWALSAARGMLLALIIVAGAPLAAYFFRAPALTPIMRVLALVQVLNGLSSLGPTLLQRTLDFKTLAYFTLGYEFAGLLAASLAAVLLQSVWAIVIGTVASALAALALSYILHPYRPRLRFARRSAGELWRFGKHLTGASILAFLINMGDNGYVGKVLGTEAVGFYDLAYRLGNLPANSITQVLMRVSFPAFSSIQDDIERMRRLYLRGLRSTTLVAVPICGAMVALAPFLVGVLYGEKWMPAVPAFMVLCFFGLERTANSVTGPVFMARNRPDFQWKIALLKLGAMAAGIVPLTALYGFVGTAIAVALAAAAVWIAVIPWTARLLQLPICRILKELLIPTLGTILMVGVIVLLRYLVQWPISLLSLLVLGAVGGIVYLAFVAATEKDLVKQARSFLADLTPAPDQR